MKTKGFFFSGANPSLSEIPWECRGSAGSLPQRSVFRFVVNFLPPGFQGPFQILLKGKEFYYLSWNEHAPYEEKTVRVPGVSGLTCRFVSKKQPPDTMPAHEDGAHALKTLAPKHLK